MNWDDLRVIAAVREQGTYAGASARLRLDETTVARRVARVQDSLGVTLFNAVDGVRKPTASCETILIHVHEIARHIAGIGNVGKSAHDLDGRFRIASTPSIAEEILAPRIAQFLEANPGLSLQLMASDANVNFSRWETDFAIRLRKPQKGEFTISKLADIRLFLFEPVAPPSAPLVSCYPEALDWTAESRQLMARRLHTQARCITENHRVTRALLKTGAGIGILPEHMCRDLLNDERLRATPLASRQEAWLLVQTHLKRDPAARAVIEWIRDSFSALSPRDTYVP